jgi:hypothetical protein
VRHGGDEIESLAAILVLLKNERILVQILLWLAFLGLVAGDVPVLRLGVERLGGLVRPPERLIAKGVQTVFQGLGLEHPVGDGTQMSVKLLAVGIFAQQGFARLPPRERRPVQVLPERVLLALVPQPRRAPAAREEDDFRVVCADDPAIVFEQADGGNPAALDARVSAAQGQPEVFVVAARHLLLVVAREVEDAVIVEQEERHPFERGGAGGGFEFRAERLRRLWPCRQLRATCEKRSRGPSRREGLEVLRVILRVPMYSVLMGRNSASSAPRHHS